MKIRFLSPHLTIYQPQFNSILSIFNRISGLFIFFFVLGTVYLTSLLSMTGVSYSVYLVCFAESLLHVFFSYLLIMVFVLSLGYHLVNNVEFVKDLIGRPIIRQRLDMYMLQHLFSLWILKLIFVGLFVFWSYICIYYSIN